ncbi:Holliday junction resolvase RuvX [Candidatus Dependentiae bacterium]
MRILALDIGDKWTGSAISDPLGILARPYKTVETNEIEIFLSETIGSEKIEKIIVGYPKTMRGTESEQTKKIKELKEKLEKTFDLVEWQLWDERFSSKRAASVKKARTKEEKIFSHSIAASFILDSYLTFIHTQKSL